MKWWDKLAEYGLIDSFIERLFGTAIKTVWDYEIRRSNKNGTRKGS